MSHSVIEVLLFMDKKKEVLLFLFTQRKEHETKLEKKENRNVVHGVCI
jgi:hypothetical protein